MQARQGEHDRCDEPDEAERDPALAAPRRQRADRHRRGVLALGPLDAQRGRHLLEEDEDRDAGGEALDDRPRQHARVAAESQSPGGDEQDAGEERDDDHPAGAVRRDDRGEHDGHRAGRAADLHVRAAEHAGDDAGDDRGDQAGLGSDARGDAERERQRERDDRDGDAGEQVRAPPRAQPAVVAAAGQQPGDGRDAHVARNSSRVAVTMSSRICFATARTSAMRGSASA
jgi:hypothetical protein